MKKAPVLDLNLELRALDRKQRDFLNTLTPEQSRAFSAFLMLKYSANVQADPELAAYYLQATNEQVNVNFWQQPVSAQWLALTTVSPGLGSQRHYWLRTPKRAQARRVSPELFKRCREILTTWKDSDLELWIQLNGETQIQQWLWDQGLE